MKRSPITFWLPLLLSTARAEVVELSPLEVTAGEARLKVEREEIATATGQTLGDLLEDLPGLHNRSFGPAVGRPVGRGHGGHRLAILQGGVGLGDVSALSGDHALALSAGALTEVRIVRGAETLLYGSGLLGGLVLTEEGLLNPPLDRSEGGYRFRSVDGGHLLRFRGGVAGRPPSRGWFTLMGSRFWHGDLSTGRGRLDHSFGRRWLAASGLGFGRWVALGYRHLQKRYGVPLQHRPEIELRHHRFQLRASPLPDLELTTGWAGYRHRELEKGEVAGRWRRCRLEGRVVWRGERWLVGLQGVGGRLEVEGDEANLPPSWERAVALFFRARWPDEVDWFFRLEQQRLETDSTLRRDLLVSGGFRIERHAGPHLFWLDGLTTARAPAPEELFFSGVHHALGGFQEGRPDLKIERGSQLEFGYRFRSQSWSFWGTLFVQRFGDYIYWERRRTKAALQAKRERFGDDLYGEQDDGELLEGHDLPLWRATQKDARFLGFEATFSYTARSWTLTLFGDLSRGWLASGGDVPLMPPFRYGLQLTLFPSPEATLEFRLLRSEPQRRKGKGEEAAPAFLRLDVKGSFRFSLEEGELLLFAAAENLLDQTILPATAFRKIPTAGRGVQVGLEVRF